MVIIVSSHIRRLAFTITPDNINQGSNILHLWYKESIITSEVLDQFKQADTNSNSDNDYAKLTNITFSSNLSSIGSRTFSSCPYIRDLTIPATTQEISNNAFEDASGLTTLTFLGERPTNFYYFDLSGTNLQNIYYIEGNDRWRPEILSYSGLDISVNIMPIPYNQNLIGD